MTTYHLSDVEYAQFTAAGLIVVDGEIVGVTIMDDVQEPLTIAPEFWRKLTEPCPTCSGTGRSRTIALPVGTPCLNPDCVGGRQVIELMHGGETIARVLVAIHARDDGRFGLAFEVVD